MLYCDVCLSDMLIGQARCRLSEASCVFVCKPLYARVTLRFALMWWGLQPCELGFAAAHSPWLLRLVWRPAQADRCCRALVLCS